jgi:hypothetical protein
MQIGTKAQIARATLTALFAVASLVILGVLVSVLCVGFHVNPFKETTTSFLVASFTGLIGVSAVLVLLNVAANLGLIADAKILELKADSSPHLLRRWIISILAAAIILVGLIFGGAYVSKEKYLAIVRGQADEVLKENKSLLEETALLLASGQVSDYKRIYEIRKYLQNQRSGLPELTIIYSGRFGGKLAFYRVNEYFPGDVDKRTYEPHYFRCTANLDCDYLKRFFSGEKTDILQKYTVRDDEFYIYMPYAGKDTRFMLLFNRRNEYGKLGS